MIRNTIAVLLMLFGVGVAVWIEYTLYSTGQLEYRAHYRYAAQGLLSIVSLIAGFLLFKERPNKNQWRPPEKRG